MDNVRYVVNGLSLFILDKNMGNLCYGVSISNYLKIEEQIILFEVQSSIDQIFDKEGCMCMSLVYKLYNH